MKPALIDIIKVGNILGEGVQWDDLTQTLWWTDIQARQLYRYRPANGALKQYPTPYRLCSFGFVARRSGLIAAFDRGIALYDPTLTDSKPLQCPPGLAAEVRFNDGKVDRQGRFWTGTMVEVGDPTLKPAGNLYSVDAEHRLRVHESGVGIANGLCWSPDAERMYFADSSRRTIYCYDFEPESGTIHNREVLAVTARGACPDGAETDCDGCLWSAHWGASKVVRYTPAGKTDTILELPVSQPTCITFGGADLDLLFVTSAREGLAEADLREQPEAGNVFVYRVGASGLPASRFIPERP
ncbi:MAG: SMP-30/gluconolactonase/LRE family protein [Gammaproteobacteria bacterium]|nr:SMP-30/gluconolactonase/LRE family protein [Gammaproteobacteria bacterium]